MRALNNDPIANLYDSDTVTKLHSLHPALQNHVTLLNPTSITRAPSVEEPDVLRTVKHMNPHSAPGTDRMSPRFLHLLFTSPVSPEAGVSASPDLSGA